MHVVTRLTQRLTRANTRSAMLLSTLAATSSLLALVIWIKLRVVTHIPRSAYADPRDEVAAQTPGPVQPTQRDIDGTSSGAPGGESASAGESIDDPR